MCVCVFIYEIITFYFFKIFNPKNYVNSCAGWALKDNFDRIPAKNRKSVRHNSWHTIYANRFGNVVEDSIFYHVDSPICTFTGYNERYGILKNGFFERQLLKFC